MLNYAFLECNELLLTTVVNINAQWDTEINLVNDVPRGNGAISVGVGGHKFGRGKGNEPLKLVVLVKSVDNALIKTAKRRSYAQLSGWWLIGRQKTFSFQSG